MNDRDRGCKLSPLELQVLDRLKRGLDVELEDDLSRLERAAAAAIAAQASGPEEGGP